MNQSYRSFEAPEEEDEIGFEDDEVERFVRRNENINTPTESSETNSCWRQCYKNWIPLCILAAIFLTMTINSILHIIREKR